MWGNSKRKVIYGRYRSKSAISLHLYSSIILSNPLLPFWFELLRVSYVCWEGRWMFLIGFQQPSKKWVLNVTTSFVGPIWWVSWRLMCRVSDGLVRLPGCFSIWSLKRLFIWSFLWTLVFLWLSTADTTGKFFWIVLIYGLLLISVRVLRLSRCCRLFSRYWRSNFSRMMFISCAMPIMRRSWREISS